MLSVPEKSGLSLEIGFYDFFENFRRSEVTREASISRVVLLHKMEGRQNPSRVARLEYQEGARQLIGPRVASRYHGHFSPEEDKSNSPPRKKRRTTTTTSEVRKEIVLDLNEHLKANPIALAQSPRKQGAVDSISPF